MASILARDIEGGLKERLQSVSGAARPAAGKRHPSRDVVKSDAEPSHGPGSDIAWLNELKALADFYGSSAGQSAMGKMGTYMADAMQGVTVQMQKAVALTRQQLQSQPK